MLASYADSPEVQFRNTLQKSGITPKATTPTNSQMYCKHLFLIKNPAVSGKCEGRLQGAFEFRGDDFLGGIQMDIG